MCECAGRGGGGPAQQTQSPRGLSLLSLSNGLKSSFNEYRVKINGKSIMAIKAGRLQPAKVLKSEWADA